MKISILTPTYNRANTLPNLYASLIKNSEYGVELEWLIMDDGSVDNTKGVIEEFVKENKIQIKYFSQNNSGKMAALNNIVNKATGELIIECDSDDYLTKSAVKYIKEKYESIEKKDDLYALVFLKYNEKMNNIGSNFKDENIKTTMFDLYYKAGLEGDKALVFFADKRKQFSYVVEKDEKFSTEARMHHKMDKQYKVICCNKPIMICEYRNDGYSKNIKEVFMNNPYAHYHYFKEMFEFDMSGVLFKKRLYIIKHYILFCNLLGKKHILKDVKGIANKLLTILLYIPGNIKTNMYKKS